MSIMRKMQSAMKTFGTRGTPTAKRGPTSTSPGKGGGGPKNKAVQQASRALKRHL